MRTKSLSVVKKMTGLILMVCMLLNVNVKSVWAADEYFYKGDTITYNRGSGIYLYTDKWNGGFLWLDSYKEKYYLTNSYMRCLTYYCDEWIANQGQTLTLSINKSVTRSVEDGVSSELGIKNVISVNIGSQHKDKVTTNYSTSLGLTYRLSKFKHKSYKIAAMGYYDKFKVNKYKNGDYKKTYYAYAYNSNFGQEIRLVYRR